MKPGFKFVSFAAIICCSAYVIPQCSAFFLATEQAAGVFGVFSVLLTGSQRATALPPHLFHKRMGSPMPQLGRPVSLEEDDDSDEDEEDLLEDESRPRVEPHITPMNRDQCLAKLLCGMSVPVTGGSSKRNYYNEYANIVSKYFEAFPLDDEIQSKESIETYDDYSTEDDGKPTRMNSRRKPLNSSRVAATAPTLQLFDLALVDVAKPEDVSKNRTRKAAFEKVSTGNRVARARRIVENLGQKLQTVRQCQSIAGCPFTFKQLREKLKKNEAQRVSSNVPLLPPGPPRPVSTKQKEEPSKVSFQPKPFAKPPPRPSRPLPPKPKPESVELFSQEDPVFPFKDTHKGDDEMEEIFGPAPVSKRPMGYHHGVDEHYSYEYNPDKPWRPGATEGNSYGQNPWRVRPRPRPQPKPFTGTPAAHHHHHRPQQHRPRPGVSTKISPSPQQQQNRRPPTSTGGAPRPKRPVPPPPPPAPTTPRSPFPKKKISYLSSPYKKPSGSNEDDEGNEDINKVAPFELIGNSDAGEDEPTFKKTTTQKPETTTEFTTSASVAKKKKKDDDDSDEYDDDDYDDDEYEDDDALDEADDDDNYSDEEDDAESEAKKKKKTENKEKSKEKKKKEKEEKEDEDKDEEEEEDEEDKPKTTTTTPKPVKKINKYFDDETEDVHEIWTKLQYATTGANYKPPEKLKKKEKTRTGQTNTEVEAIGGEAVSDEEEVEADDKDDATSKAPTSKIQASSSSASSEDEADDEVDEENASKPKRSKSKSKKSKGKAKKKTATKEKEEEEEEEAADIVEEENEPEKEQNKNVQEKKTKKTKKDKKKKKGSSEEDDRRKHFMMEIGGRPLVPKPDHDQLNTKKTSSLIGNRLKFQFINPYGPAPPGDVNLPGAYVPNLRTGYGATPAPAAPPQSALGNAVSSLPFKFKLNPGALGSLAGGSGIMPLGGFPSLGSSSAMASLEPPDPNQPPPPSGYLPPPPSHKSQGQHQQRQESFGSQSSLSSLTSGSIRDSNLFKQLNKIPALSNLFKRPSNNFDSQNGSPPPVNAFIHRPIGPESSHFKRTDQKSPASGSSAPKKSTKSKSSSKGKKEKTVG